MSAASLILKSIPQCNATAKYITAHADTHNHIYIYTYICAHDTYINISIDVLMPKLYASYHVTETVALLTWAEITTLKWKT